MRASKAIIRAATRTLIVTTIGVLWFVASPFIFIWGLPQFGFYTQWMTNYGTNTNDVYQFWTLIPEVGLFFLGIFWAGGFGELIMEHLH